MPDKALAPGGKARRAAAFLCGFGVLFNIYLVPGSGVGASPRLTDLMGAVLVVCVGWLFLRGRANGPVLAVLAALAVPPLILAIVTMSGGLADEAPFSKTTFTGVRWVLALNFGYVADLFARDAQTRPLLVLGFILAAVGNMVVVLLQSGGLAEAMVAFGLAAPEAAFSWINMTLRPSGMQGHANGSTAVVSLVVPAVFYLYWSGRVGVWACAVALGILLLTVALTLTRGPLIATLISLGLSAVVFRHVRATTPMFVAAALAMVLALSLVGPPGGWERWSSEASTDENFTERMSSNIATLELIAHNPFGIGAVAAADLILAVAGVPSSHNALLSATVCFGVPFGVMFCFLLLTNILRGPASDVEALYFLLSLHALLLFCFEDLLLTPTFTGFGAWLVAGAAASLFSAPAARAMPVSRFRLPVRAP